MDALTEVLRDLRLESSFYARSELRAPWGLFFSVKDGPSFHVIVTGRCWLRINAERIPLGTGDLVLLPHGNEHQLAEASCRHITQRRKGHDHPTEYQSGKVRSFCRTHAGHSK